LSAIAQSRARRFEPIKQSPICRRRSGPNWGVSIVGAAECFHERQRQGDNLDNGHQSSARDLPERCLWNVIFSCYHGTLLGLGTSKEDMRRQRARSITLIDGDSPANLK
jgi:hypothetical protein